MTNKYMPHLLVIPEDDANRQLANGFALKVQYYRNIQILPVAGGWEHVVQTFMSEHISGMQQYSERHIVLLLDFDSRAERAAQIREKIPNDLLPRVYILGTWTEPEALRQAGLGAFETIGGVLAEECRRGTYVLWTHDLLRHNSSEISRMGNHVRGFLF